MIRELHSGGRHIADVTEEEIMHETGNRTDRTVRNRHFTSGYGYRLVSPEARAATAHLRFAQRESVLRSTSPHTSLGAAAESALRAHRETVGG